MLLSTDSLLPCIFCGSPTDDDRKMDDNGNIACRECGDAEIAAQRTEARLEKLAQMGFGDAAEFARNPVSD